MGFDRGGHRHIRRPPRELISSALTRARACEALATATGGDFSGAFMVGIMSLMDAILDCPMEAVITRLPLTSECKDALRGKDNALGKLLRLAICCERGEWEEITAISSERGLPEDAVWEGHREACRWSAEVLKKNSRRR